MISKDKPYKICTKCKEEKDIGDFYSLGIQPCKECRIQVSKEWREKRLKELYDLSLEDFDKLSQEQNNVCAICSQSCKTDSNLTVDHNHDTGKVRGLLCRQCNRALGMFEDNTSLLYRAIKYLHGPLPERVNDGNWTAARFNSFIKSALRQASTRWGPKAKVKQKARVRRGFYECVGWNREAHECSASLPPKPGNKRRINNAKVDHIEPIIDPAKGFVSWDEVIKRMFVEEDGLQLLCASCHDEKTAEERHLRNVTRKSKENKETDSGDSI